MPKNAQEKSRRKGNNSPNPPAIFCPCCGERLNGKLDRAKVLELAGWIKRSRARVERKKARGRAGRALYNWLRLKERMKERMKMKMNETNSNSSNELERVSKAIYLALIAEDQLKTPENEQEIIFIIKSELIKQLNA